MVAEHVGRRRRAGLRADTGLLGQTARIHHHHPLPEPAPGGPGENRLARKILTSFAGINYPSPRPCPVVQNAYAAGAVEIEHWTMRTIPQRLLAGAMGWDFMPTHP
jgi:hypothetical protein